MRNMSLDHEFRAAMRRLAATVSVITLRTGDRPMGMTATAVTSLSMSPPSVLVCVNQTVSMYGSFIEADTFCVNILHQDHLEVARVFSDSKLRSERFVTGQWQHRDNTPPILIDAQAALLCERRESLTFGTHSIFIGQVSEILLRDDIAPLLYVDGRFSHTT